MDNFLKQWAEAVFISKGFLLICDRNKDAGTMDEKEIKDGLIVKIFIN